MKNSNECDINDLFLKLKSQLLVWQDSSFEQFLSKCYSKQTRSGDESTSVFALCSSCKSKWVL